MGECLEGEVLSDREGNIRKGAICCVVNNQMLGFKLWVKGEEEELVERRHPDRLIFRPSLL